MSSYTASTTPKNSNTSTNARRSGSSSSNNNNNTNHRINTVGEDPDVDHIVSRTAYFWTSNRELRHYKWINVVAYTMNAMITYGVGTLGWFNLPTNAVLSSKYQTLITPIGWAFSIWAIIFTMQFIWTVQQFACCTLPNSYVQAIVTVHYNYVYVSLAQILWTFCFGFELIEVSLFMMFVLLYNLFAVTSSIRRLNQEQQPSPQRQPGTALSSNVVVYPKSSTISSFFFEIGKYLLTEFPFIVHFGWILVATFVNINVTFVAQAIPATIKFYFAIISLVVLLLVTVVLLFMRDMVVPTLIVVWGLLGIYKELESPNDLIVSSYTVAQQGNVQFSALIGMIFIAVMMTIYLIRRTVLYCVERSAAATRNTNTEPQEIDYFRAP